MLFRVNFLTFTKNLYNKLVKYFSKRSNLSLSNETFSKNLTKLYDILHKLQVNLINTHTNLKDLEHFQNVNSVMESYFDEPYPSRAAVEVSRLPKDVSIEMDAILYVEK